MYLYCTVLEESKPELCSKITVPGKRITTARWGPFNRHIYTGAEDGEVAMWDWQTGEKIQSSREHSAQIHDLQWAADQTHFITASKDNTAKIFDAVDLMPLKTYVTDRPVNSASISPLKEHVILGGGQEAAQVTTTSVRAGKFEVRFYHKILEEEIGRVKGHFGPINTVAFHPDGKSFSSGGEDGFVRVHHFDSDYFSFQGE